MANVFNRFQQLLPQAVTTVVTITALNGDGTSDATTLGGVAVIINGESVAVGQKAYIQNDSIVRQAPDLPITRLDI